MTEPARPDVAVIGGSGFYTFLEDPREVEVDTPYGKPSASIAVGTVEGRPVAFLPRHGGPEHRQPVLARGSRGAWAMYAMV